MENVELDDAGDAAVDRILKYIPEARVWVDYDGTVVFDSRTGGAEAAQVDAMRPELVGKGHIVKLSNARLRPSRINVLFTREIEVRFNFKEPATASGTVALGANDRKCDNVLPIPDYQLTVSGQSYAEGTWITFPQAMNAWDTLSSTFGKLDYDILCKAFVPFMDLWAALQHLGSQNDIANWAPRLAAVQQHWRQTFRINQRWNDRILSLRPYRVGTIDRTTGSRSPAVAYCDYVSLGTQRLWLSNIRSGTDAQYARNYTCYADGDMLGSSNRPAPAIVSIVDEDQGIIRADFQADVIRLTDMVLPGNVVDASVPTAQIDLAGRSFRPLTFDSIIGSTLDNIPRLSGEHAIAFILTAIPGAPNNNTQLHKVTVGPNDVADIVGNIGPCNGPEWNIRIGSNVETARIKWQDSQSAVIERAFGIGVDVPAAQSADDSAVLNTLCVNYETSGDDGASLKAIAKAAAARVYAHLADRQVGSASGIINGLLRPAGWLAGVVHEVATNGEPTTHLALPEAVPQLSLFGYMDANTRAIVMREVK
jgi:hypothetical protein